MARVARLGVVVDASGAKRGASEASLALNSMENAAKRAQSSMIAAGAALVGAFAFGKTVREAQAFEKQMGMVATVTDKTTASMRVLGSGVLQLLGDLPVESMEELTKGLYDIISAGIPAGDALNYLSVSAKAAIGGITSTAVAVDGLTSVTNAWRLQNVGVQEAADKMFEAVKVGKITFEQLAANIGKVAPVAAAYNLKLEDMLGATAQLTINGLSAEMSIVGIRSAMVNILNPASEFTRQFPELAKEFNATKLEGVGFVGFLREFAERSKGSKEALNSLFRDIQGNTAVLSLLADGGAAATEKVRAVGEASGTATGAFNELAGTSAAVSQQLRNRLTVTLIEIGQKALPLVNEATKILIRGLTWMQSNLPTIAGITAALATAMTGYMIATRGAALATAVLAAANTISAVISLAKSIRSAADAMALLQIVGGGAAKAVIAVAAIAAGVAAYKLASRGLAKDTAEFNAELERMAKLGGTGGAPPPLPTGLSGGGATVDAEALAKAKELRAANEDRVRLARQAWELVGLETEAASRLRAEQTAVNAEVEARRNLTGEQLSAALRSIELEKQWNLAAATGEAIAERRKKATDARKETADKLQGMQRESAELAAQVVALQQGRDVYERTLVLQAQNAAVLAEQTRLKALNLTLSEGEEQAIRAAVAETARLTKLRDALASLDGKSPFDLSEFDTGKAGDFADTLSQALSAAQGITSAFGEMGRSISAVVGQAAQLFTNLSRIQSAGVFTDAEGKTKNAGFFGALRGEAGKSGQVQAVTGALGAVGAVVAVADALDLFGTKAKERAKQMREAAEAFNRALADFGRSAGTDLEEAVRSSLTTVNELLRGAAAASGGTFSGNVQSVDELDAMIASMQGLANTSASANAALQPFIDRMREVSAKAKEVAEALRVQQQAELARLSQDLEVRRLTAAGDTEAAEALRRRLADEAEVLELQKKYGAAAAEQIAALREVQAAEREAAATAKALAEAEKARTAALQRQQFGLDLQARRQDLSGDARGALQTRGTISNANALEQARGLLEAGIITQAMFDELASVLNDELNAALRDFDQAAREAAQALAQERQNKLNDLAVRALVAQGDVAGAERLRQEIANQQELAGVTDEVLVAEILRVQALEETARALEQAAALERTRVEQNRSITEQMIDAYRTLNPAEADRLEALLLEQERTELLRGAVDDATRARYEELFALQDQAKATQRLAEEQRAAAEAAKALANLTADIEEQWLRESGRVFEADVKGLEKWRDEQLAAAKAAGATAATIQQILDIFDLKYQKLIAGTIDNATPGGVPGGTPGGGQFEYATASVTRSISGQEALRLVDIATSQLVVLRQIASNTAEGSGGGVRVNVTVQGGTYSDSPREVGTTIGTAVAAQLDKTMGRRTGIGRIVAGIDTL